MRNIILAIGAILCLQFSFQVYMALDRTDAEYQAMAPVEGQQPQQQSVADIPPAPSFIDAETPAIRVVARRTPVERTPAVVRGPRPATIRSATVAKLSTLKRQVRNADIPVVRPPLQTTLTTESAVAANIERREKASRKNLIAKVITKPYSWIKSVGSFFK